MKRYEITGESADAVVKAIIGLRFYYGQEKVLVDNPIPFMLKKDKVSVSIDFSDDIKLQSGGEDPRENIVNEMNYVFGQEMMNVSIAEADQVAPKAEKSQIVKEVCEKMGVDVQEIRLSNVDETHYTNRFTGHQNH